MLKMVLLVFFLTFTYKALAQNFDWYPATRKSDWSPASTKKAPVLVFVHGGAWVSGDKSDYKTLAAELTSKKLCVAVLQYSLAPQSKHPIPVEQLQSALQKIISTPEKNCDTQNIFLVGHSAGAHMIAFWATQHQTPEVQGFIGLEGIYDLPQLAEKWPDYEAQFLIAAFGRKNLWPEASPSRLNFISRKPWLIVHSKQDELVDTQQSLNFKKHLQSENISATYLELTKETHFQVLSHLSSKKETLGKSFFNFMTQQKP